MQTISIAGPSCKRYACGEGRCLGSWPVGDFYDKAHDHHRGDEFEVGRTLGSEIGEPGSCPSVAMNLLGELAKSFILRMLVPTWRKCQGGGGGLGDE